MPKSLKLKLDLRDSADFRLVVPTRRKYVVAGTDAVYTVKSDALTGYIDDVDLSVSGLPTGASATIGSDPIGNDGQTTITVETTGTSAGSYNFLIGGAVYTPPEDIYYADSPALVDVQAAIAAAGSGDAVIVPAGNATWNSQLVITKGILLLAETPGGVTITSTYVGAGGRSDTTYYLIVYNPSSPLSNDPFRISGFVWDCDWKCGWLALRNSSVTPITRIRLDHNSVKDANQTLHRQGHIYGVADNNTLDQQNRPGISVSNYGMNASTWNNLTFSFGSSDNFYHEDNTFYFQDYFDHGLGGRSCFRYNQWYYTHPTSGAYPWFDAHGNMSFGGNHSTQGFEIYENDITVVNNVGCRMLDQRGGKGLFYNNRITTSGSASFQCREEYNDADNPPATAPDGQPQHVFNTYFWNNLRNGSLVTPTISETYNYGGDEGPVPQWDRDCWKEVVGFDGSTGMGKGLLSARPVSCSLEGAGYWATDQNKLYRWHSGAWELYYTPYTYPHPHRSDPVLGDY